MQDITTYRIGDATITKISEIALDGIEGSFLFPGVDPDSIARERGAFGPGSVVLHHLNEPFLERLKAAGVSPEDVDLVLMTHLHADHVGWNTRLVDGRWVPTF